MKLAFLTIALITSVLLKAQQGYAVNDQTTDIPVNKIINSSLSATGFRQLNDRLTILDFFGTWCVPCIKALPNLMVLQKNNKDQLRVILVSNETESKLAGFLSKRKNVSLPVIVDTPNIFGNYFQPPSLPYTVIITKNGRVMAFPKEEELTQENISRWLKEQDSPSSRVATKITPGINNNNNIMPSQNKLVQLSQDFMYAAKTGEETHRFITQFSQHSLDSLLENLKTDDAKNAFWIFFQRHLGICIVTIDPKSIFLIVCFQIFE